MMKNIVLSCFLLLMASCSQYDWSPNELLYGQPSAPMITVGPDVVLTDADNLSVPYLLPVTISDPNTDNASLTVTWSGNSNNPAPVSMSGGFNQYVALFPKNGVYQLTINVSDGESQSQSSIVITVNARTTFSIDGDVKDNLSNVIGVPVVLRFTDGTLIETISTDNAGGFSFNNLVGSLINYEVVVQ